MTEQEMLDEMTAIVVAVRMDNRKRVDSWDKDRWVNDWADWIEWHKQGRPKKWKDRNDAALVHQYEQIKHQVSQ